MPSMAINDTLDQNELTNHADDKFNSRENQQKAEEIYKESAKKYSSYALFSMNVPPPLKPEFYMSSKYDIDDETRYRLHLMEK